MQLVRDACRAIKEGALAVQFHLAPYIGRKRRYAIAPGYRHRDRIRYFDDTENADEWQREVYLAALQIMRELGLKKVCDVGCGSGYKLAHILGDFETLGIDLQPTIERVRQRYPDREWIGGSFENLHPPDTELVICADVIEHVADPDALMRFLTSTGAKHVVISTPDRDRVYKGKGISRFGPPGNEAHLREWSLSEFHDYVSSFLIVERHQITNEEQATQMIVGRPFVERRA